MITLTDAALRTIAEQAPAALGEILFTTAVDRSLVMRHGIAASIRRDMTDAPQPAALASLLAHEADASAPDMPAITCRAAPDFTLVLSRFPGEGECDAYIVVGDPASPIAVLHSRNAGRQEFSIVDAGELDL